MSHDSATSFGDSSRAQTRPRKPVHRDVARGDTSVSTTAFLDAAFAGRTCEVVRADGTCRVMASHRWSGDATPTDIALFVDACEGPTLDVGCGPGRLTGALADRGLDVLGIDISAEAVRQTRRRGAAAVRQDVFVDLPGSILWHHILLADGNIGIGGHPVRLLQRIGELFSANGTALVEVAGHGAVSVHEHVQLRMGAQMSRPFTWATVGPDAISEVAAAAGLIVSDLRCISQRHVASLRHRSTPGSPANGGAIPRHQWTTRGGSNSGHEPHQ